MNAEQTETHKKALELSAMLTRFYDKVQLVDAAIGRVESFENASDSIHKQAAWQRLDISIASVEAAHSTLVLSEVPSLPEPIGTSLLYAAEVAVNRLRELPGGHGYEVELLVDGIRNAGGLPEGRDQDGNPL